MPAKRLAFPHRATRDIVEAIEDHKRQSQVAEPNKPQPPDPDPKA